MDEKTKIFCAGAATAYRDMADKLEDMAKKAPDDLKQYIELFFCPIARMCRESADNIFIEAEKYYDLLNAKTDGNA